MAETIFFIILFLVIIIIMFAPIAAILRARYITVLEKTIWSILSVSWLPILIFTEYQFQQKIKYTANKDELNTLITCHHDTSPNGVIMIFWALLIFIIFKITYARKQAIWEKHNGIKVGDDKNNDTSI